MSGLFNISFIFKKVKTQLGTVVESVMNILKKMNTILRQTLPCVSRCAVFTKPEGKTQLRVLKHQTDYWQPVRARKETPARRPSAAVLLLPPSDQIQVCSIFLWKSCFDFIYFFGRGCTDKLINYINGRGRDCCLLLFKVTYSSPLCFLFYFNKMKIIWSLGVNY